MSCVHNPRSDRRLWSCSPTLSTFCLKQTRLQPWLDLFSATVWVLSVQPPVSAVPTLASTKVNIWPMRQGRVEVQEAMVKAFQQGSEGWNQRTQETEQKVWKVRHKAQAIWGSIVSIAASQRMKGTWRYSHISPLYPQIFCSWIPSDTLCNHDSQTGPVMANTSTKTSRPMRPASFYPLQCLDLPLETQISWEYHGSCNMYIYIYDMIYNYYNINNMIWVCLKMGDPNIWTIILSEKNWQNMINHCILGYLFPDNPCPIQDYPWNKIKFSRSFMLRSTMYVQYFVRYPPKKALIRDRPARQPRLTGWLCGFDTTSSQSATCLQDLKTQERSANSPKMNRITMFEYSPIMFLLSFQSEKTRCSPRTGMLTCMLMAQMSKHMNMQSRQNTFLK